MADEDIIPPHHRCIPLNALRVSARKKLSLYLNLERLPNDEGIVADFNGLAELVGFDYLEIQNFGRQKDPTGELLAEWGQKPDLNPTMGNLVDYLQEMGREDVLTDCKMIMMKDIDHYVQQRARFQNDQVPLQDDTVSQSTTESPMETDGTDHSIDETLIMTTDDVKNGCPTYYHAFVCYNPENYDLQFVKKMISRLESEPYNLKLFVPWRDDLPGSSEHTINAKLIQERCRRMIIIMSPRYLRSPSCDFQTKFAHSLSPGSRSKKLVPVLITPCGIPQILRHVTLCDFTKMDLMEWFWERLARAISAPLDPSELQISSQISLSDIQLNLDLSKHTSGSSSSSYSLPDLPPPKATVSLPSINSQNSNDKKTELSPSSDMVPRPSTLPSPTRTEKPKKSPKFKKRPNIAKLFQKSSAQ